MKDLDKNMIVTASFLMAITIALGAFGAHGLKNLVDSAALDTFETGVRYQIYHSLAIFMLGLATGIPHKVKCIVFWLFITGIIFFSGSIYLLALKVILPFNPSVIGFITPVGGLLFIIGWFLLAFKVAALKWR